METSATPILMEYLFVHNIRPLSRPGQNADVNPCPPSSSLACGGEMDEGMNLEWHTYGHFVNGHHSTQKSFLEETTWRPTGEGFQTVLFMVSKPRVHQDHAAISVC